MFAALKKGGVIPAFTSPTPLALEKPVAPVPEPCVPSALSTSTTVSKGEASNGTSGDDFTVRVLAIPEGTEDFELKEHFSSCGKVTKVSILPVQEGKVTSLGYVSFATSEGVQNAVKKNGIEFNGSPLRILASGISTQQFQVKVYNIPEKTGEETIRSYFSSAGEVLRVWILACRPGKDVTLGFITYATEAGCKRAVAEMNGYEIDGSKLNVVYENDQNGGGSGGSGGGSNGFSGFGNGTSGGVSLRPQVKVYNIPEATGEETLKSMFASVGEVERVKILDSREGKDVTLGFVTFATEAGCRRAVAELSGQEIGGSKLNVIYENDQNGSGSGGGGAGGSSGGAGGGVFGSRPSNSGASAPPGGPQAKVFGIPDHSDHADLKQYFSPAGEVKHVKVLNLLPGRDTCAGFIYFTTTEEVERAVSLFNGAEFNGSVLKVMVGQSGGSSGGTQFSQLNGSRETDGPTSRLPRLMDTIAPPSTSSTDGMIMLPDSNESSMACRRCGEVGHWARECVNAPVAVTTQAVIYIPPDPPETVEEIFAQGNNVEGINFDKYDCIPVELGGNNAPRPIPSFQDAKLHQICLENIARAKYKKPTPVQKYAIPGILEKRDVMACAQTGSGKTVAFLLPMITNMLNDGVVGSRDFEGCASPLVCIMSPTRELAVQIFLEARKFSYGTDIKPVVVYGGVSVNHQIERLQMGCHICVATPGRLDDFVKRGRISFRKLQYLVLDEADKMLDMGFGPQIGEIIHNSEMPPRGSRTTLMFSATFPDEIQKMAADFLNEYLFLAVGRVGGTCADVTQVILEVTGRDKRNKLVEILQKRGSDRTLVFVEKKQDADFLACWLSQNDHPTTSMNADRSQQERENALLDFRTGIAPVLVATAVAARGLDIKDVKHVINFDLPSDTTEYVHRIGRTGRIGHKGLATSFFDPMRDDRLARGLVKLLSEGEQDVPEWLESTALNAVGTGYGQNRVVSDQRTKPEIGSYGSRLGNRAGDNGGGDDDDEEEEW